MLFTILDVSLDIRTYYPNEPIDVNSTCAFWPMGSAPKGGWPRGLWPRDFFRSL